MSGLIENPADSMSYNAASIMENLDRWAADPFNVDLLSLQTPSNIINATSQLVEELKNLVADLNAAIH